MRGVRKSRGGFETDATLLLNCVIYTISAPSHSPRLIDRCSAHILTRHYFRKRHSAVCFRFVWLNCSFSEAHGFVDWRNWICRRFVWNSKISLSRQTPAKRRWNNAWRLWRRKYGTSKNERLDSFVDEFGGRPHVLFWHVLCQHSISNHALAAKWEANEYDYLEMTTQTAILLPGTDLLCILWLEESYYIIVGYFSRWRNLYVEILYNQHGGFVAVRSDTKKTPKDSDRRLLYFGVFCRAKYGRNWDKSTEDDKTKLC